MNAARGRLVIVNPNTNARVTLWLAEEARRVAGTAIEVIAVNAESGIEAIETPEHLEIAARAVASEVAKHRGASGAVVAASAIPASRRRKRSDSCRLRVSVKAECRRRR